MRLRIESGPDAGRIVPVNGETFAIGRGSDSDLVVADDDVSRHHARIERQPDGSLVLVDLESTNGTEVDGRRIARQVLAGGERIQVGDTLLLAELDGASAETLVTDDDRTRVGRPALRPPPAKEEGALPPPPPETPPRSASRIQSRIERIRLRKRANRALLAAVAALAVAVVAVVLAVTGVFGGDEPTVESVVAQVSPSTALVIINRDGERLGNGSGWVLDAERGLIVTNAHVVNGGETFDIGLGGRMRPATVVGVAPCEDLAVLRVRDTEGLRALPLGSQETLRQGRTVVAIGFPTNASLRDNLTSTAGVVSVVQSTYRFPAADVPRYPNVIQTDAAINPGNSGGPLVDLDGRLVGVNSAGFDLAGGRLIQGQGYAIGVDRARRILDSLQRGQSIGWTGLGLEYRDEAFFRERGIPPGLIAVGAVPDTPAARAGFDADPSLLLAINGKRVESRLQSYCDAVRGIASGERATFTVLGPRDPAPRDVRVRFH